jgi:hypothetical protein
MFFIIINWLVLDQLRGAPDGQIYENQWNTNIIVQIIHYKRLKKETQMVIVVLVLHRYLPQFRHL